VNGGRVSAHVRGTSTAHHRRRPSGGLAHSVIVLVQAVKSLFRHERSGDSQSRKNCLTAGDLSGRECLSPFEGCPSPRGATEPIGPSRHAARPRRSRPTNTPRLSILEIDFPFGRNTRSGRKCRQDLLTAYRRDILTICWAAK
jgi:hypothetical protein